MDSGGRFSAVTEGEDFLPAVTYRHLQVGAECDWTVVGWVIGSFRSVWWAFIAAVVVEASRLGVYGLSAPWGAGPLGVTVRLTDTQCDEYDCRPGPGTFGGGWSLPTAGFGLDPRGRSGTSVRSLPHQEWPGRQRPLMGFTPRAAAQVSALGLVQLISPEKLGRGRPDWN